MAYPMEKKQAILKKYDELVKKGEGVINATKVCGVPYFNITVGRRSQAR